MAAFTAGPSGFGSWKRVAVAPLCAPALYTVGAIAYVLLAPNRTQPSMASIGTAVMLIFAMGSPVAYAAGAVAAFPAVWVMRRRPRGALALILLLGAGVGAATAWILQPHLHGDLVSIPLTLWEGSALGAASAGVFYWLGRPL